MNVKKMLALISGLAAIYLVSSRVISRKPAAKEYDRLAVSISIIACSEDIQKHIPIESVQPASTDFQDGVQHMAESDPKAAAQIENLVASLTPEKKEENKIDPGLILESFAKGLQNNGWSKAYVKKLISAKNPQELNQWGAVIAEKMKTQCPQASPKTAELLDAAFVALRSSKD